jgi:hypothetical protein
MSLMKNKNSLYILAPIVLFIWAVIFYRLFFAKPKAASTITLNTEPVALAEENNGFVLLLNYQNPFLKQGFDVSELNLAEQSESPITPNPISTPIQQPKILPPTLPPVKWPTIQYLGKLKVLNVTDQLALISIDGKFHKVKLGMVIKDFYVTSVWEDSIKLTNKDKSVVFNRKD